MTVDDKYSFYKSKKFGQAIQMQLSKKSKIFYLFFSAFMQSTSVFEHSGKKDEAHTSTIADII